MIENNVISREDTIAEINDTIADYMPYLVQDGRTAKIPLELTKAVMRVPPVTQKSGKWIPVSERLPEGLLVKVLVSCEDSLGLPIVPKVVIYDGYEHLWECDEKVIAWMPLPELYKAESEE